MFEQWLENLEMLVDGVEELPPLEELRRLFEAGESEWEAWCEFTGTPVCSDE